jgi:hypothetical protein
MMMSKPTSSASSEEEKSAASATSASASATATKGQGTVADLERRLAMLSTEEDAADNETVAAGVTAPTLQQMQAPSTAPAPPATAAKSGKNALLVSTTHI